MYYNQIIKSSTLFTNLMRLIKSHSSIILELPKMIVGISVLMVLMCPKWAISQDDLLSELENEIGIQEFQVPAFKAMKICNLQSTKVSGKGDLYMYVSHRFGTVRNGLTTFFGLDDANTKIQMVYGVAKGVQIGLGRESLGRTFSGSAKVLIIEQSSKLPVNVTGNFTTNYNAALSEERYPDLQAADRLSYATQLLVSSALTDRFSFELAPGLVRQNLVFDSSQRHDQLILGTGARYKLTDRTSLNADYAYNVNRSEQSIYQDPLAIGIDIETGGHVFQLLFSNAQSTNEPGFLTRAEGDWSTGDVFFGFNIVRVF